MGQANKSGPRTGVVATALGPIIDVARFVGNQRPAGHIDVARRVEGDDGAAPRLHCDGRGSGETSEAAGPGTSGVDDPARVYRTVLGLDADARVAPPADTRDSRLVRDRQAALLRRRRYMRRPARARPDDHRAADKPHRRRPRHSSNGWRTADARPRYRDRRVRGWLPQCFEMSGIGTGGLPIGLVEQEQHSGRVLKMVPKPTGGLRKNSPAAVTTRRSKGSGLNVRKVAALRPLVCTAGPGSLSSRATSVHAQLGEPVGQRGSGHAGADDDHFAVLLHLRSRYRITSSQARARDERRSQGFIRRSRARPGRWIFCPGTGNLAGPCPSRTSFHPLLRHRNACRPA